MFSRPLAAAAAILLLVGGGLSLVSGPAAQAPGYRLAQGPRDALLAYTRSRYGSIEETTVRPENLSGGAKSLVRALGMALEEQKS